MAGFSELRLFSSLQYSSLRVVESGQIRRRLVLVCDVSSQMDESFGQLQLFACPRVDVLWNRCEKCVTTCITPVNHLTFYSVFYPQFCIAHFILFTPFDSNDGYPGVATLSLQSEQITTLLAPVNEEDVEVKPDGMTTKYATDLFLLFRISRRSSKNSLFFTST